MHNNSVANFTYYTWGNEKTSMSFWKLTATLSFITHSKELLSSTFEAFRLSNVEVWYAPEKSEKAEWRYKKQLYNRAPDTSFHLLTEPKVTFVLLRRIQKLPEESFDRYTEMQNNWRGLKSMTCFLLPFSRNKKEEKSLPKKLKVYI